MLMLRIDMGVMVPRNEFVGYGQLDSLWRISFEELEKECYFQCPGGIMMRHFVQPKQQSRSS